MNQNNRLLVPGILLILAGILIFVLQWQGWSLNWLIWPLYILLPGIFIVLSSLFIEGDTGEGLSIFGSILTALGCILLFQYKTDLWETWAYMWALIPLSVGVGQIIHALIYKNTVKSHEGLHTFRTGLILFVIFAAGFELLIFKRPSSFKSIGFAILFILAGLLIIFQSKKKVSDSIPITVKYEKKAVKEEPLIAEVIEEEKVEETDKEVKKEKKAKSKE